MSVGSWDSNSLAVFDGFNDMNVARQDFSDLSSLAVANRCVANLLHVSCGLPGVPQHLLVCLQKKQFADEVIGSVRSFALQLIRQSF